MNFSQGHSGTVTPDYYFCNTDTDTDFNSVGINSALIFDAIVTQLISGI